MSRRRRVDPVRRLAFQVLQQVTRQNAYTNLALVAARRGLEARDAAFLTELVSGTARLLGTYDHIIEAASGRPVLRLQGEVRDLLRLGSHQILSMRVPVRAAVDSTVELAAAVVSERITGLVNAVLRKVAANDLDQWLDHLCEGAGDLEQLAIRSHHPLWVVEAWADRLPADELPEALAADNLPPQVHAVVRPGLAEPAELGGQPLGHSRWGAVIEGDPAMVPAIAEGRAGVQDEGSQLVAMALARPEAPAGPWLDLCAGPGGKAALLAGLARGDGTWLLGSELQPHRAALVARSLAGYPQPRRPVAICADGTAPAWRPASFSRVMADVPCSGLGALRRRPESRWRHRPADLPGLVALQRRLLQVAIESAAPGGVIAYVTCSPHRAETHQVVAELNEQVEVLSAADFLPEVAGAADGAFVQLWPHRHGTDAMFLALLRRR